MKLICSKKEVLADKERLQIWTFCQIINKLEKVI
jgi:hypothetical protein